MVTPKLTFEPKITFGNVLTIVTTIVGLVAGYATLVQSVATSAEAVKSIPGIENRVTTIETRINVGQQAREAFQIETKQALKDQAELLSQILQTQAAILARMDEKDRLSH